MKKLFLKIMNLVFIAAACFGIYKYAKTPLLEIGIDAKVEASTLNPLMAKLPLGAITGGEGEAPEIDLADYLDDIEITDVMTGETKTVPGIALKLSLKIDAQTLTGIFQAQDKEAFVKESLVTPNIDAITAEVKEPLKNVVTGLLGSVASVMIQEAILSSLPDLDAEIFEGVDVGGEIANILDAFTAEEATLDSLTAVVEQSASTLIAQINENRPEGEEIPADALEAIPELLGDTLTDLGLVDEDGNIADMDAAISALLGSFLNPTEDNGGEPQEARHPLYAEEEAETPDLTSMLVDMIMEKINPLLDTIAMGLQYGGYALLVLIGLWVIFIIKCFIKLFTKNPGMRDGLFFFIHFLIGFIFAIIHLAFGNLGFVLNTAANYGFDVATYVPANLAAYLPIVYNSSIIFNSSIVWSGYITLAIGLFVMLIYGPVRHSVKKDIKRAKKAARS